MHTNHENYSSTSLKTQERKIFNWSLFFENYFHLINEHANLSNKL